jgi:hypothetical protein
MFFGAKKERNFLSVLQGSLHRNRENLHERRKDLVPEWRLGDEMPAMLKR